MTSPRMATKEIHDIQMHQYLVSFYDSSDKLTEIQDWYGVKRQTHSSEGNVELKSMLGAEETNLDILESQQWPRLHG